MAFVLLFFGAAFILAGYHGNASQLLSKLGGEFSGTPSFGKFALGVLVVGAIGYIKPLRPISNAFLILIFVVLFLSNKGFFAQFTQQFGLAKGGSLSLANPPVESFTLQNPGSFTLPNYSQLQE